MTLRVPPRYQEATLSQLDKKMFAPVLDYVDKLEQYRKGGVGLLLSGPHGVGKTHAICALLREAQNQYQENKWFWDYEFVTAPDFFDRIPTLEDRQVLDTRRNRSWFETYTTVPWLILDDLGDELRAGGFHEQVMHKLGRVLRKRDGRCLVTHISTNLPLRPNKDYDTFPSVYKENIMSLLSQMVKSYQVNGKDRRRLER